LDNGPFRVYCVLRGNEPGGDLWPVLPGNGLEFPLGQIGGKGGFHVSNPDLAHAAPESITGKGALVYDGLALEVLLLGELNGGGSGGLIAYGMASGL
jgi:hypothetical protein